MAGVALNPYLAEIAAGLNASQQGQYALAPPPEEDPNAVMSTQPVASVQAPVVGPMPTPAAPAGMTLPTEDPATLTSHAPPATSEGPTGVLAGSDIPANTNAVQVAAPANDAAPIGPDPHAFDLQLQGGGAVPAHEMDLRGPSLTTAQNERQATYANTIGTVAGRNAQAANDEAQMYVSQERAARLREAAYQQSIAEQEEELQARQDDFDQTSRQMARLGQIDHGRFWASRSTGQKIAGAIEVMLAGFTGGQSMVMKRIDDDVRAQEFAYNAARDQANAKQTAFSAAMAKYGNVNAARAMARVASLDVVSAQLGQIAAMNKGNDTGNRALAALAQLSNDRMLMIQQGIRFVPAQAGQRYFVDPATGIIYNNKEAQEYQAKNREWRQADRTTTANIDGRILEKQIENQPGPGGLTKGDASKKLLETEEKQTAVNAMNDQFNRMISNPVLERLSPIRAARAGLPGAPRHSPEEYADKQELAKLNQEFLTTLGKVAKDNEGKPGVAMLKKFEENFRINQGFDTKESAIKNIRNVQEIANNLYAQGGAEPMNRTLSPEAQKSLGGYKK